MLNHWSLVKNQAAKAVGASVLAGSLVASGLFVPASALAANQSNIEGGGF